MQLAPLFARGAMRLLKGLVSWDQLYSVEGLKAEVVAFTGQLEVANGKKWSSSRGALVIVGDASGSQ